MSRKILVKTVTSMTAEFEMSDDATIAMLKEEIATRLNKPADTQRLVYKGKILSNDDETIAAADVSAPNWVIVTNQVKATAAPVAATPAPVARPAATPAAPAPAAPAPTSVSAPVPPPSTTGPVLTPTDAPMPAIPSQSPATPIVIDEEVVTNLSAALGFPRSAVELALRAAQGNGEIAGMLLLEGVPGEALQQMADNPAAAQHLLGRLMGGGDEEMGGGDEDDEDDDFGESDPAALAAALEALSSQAGTYTLPETHPLAELERHPQFNQLRAAVLTNPAMLQQVMALIVQQQPSMALAVQQNPEAFQQLLFRGIMPTSTGADASATPAAASSSADSATNSAAAAPAAAQQRTQITLTAEENEQVDQLVMMTGVPKNAAIEAFLICNRNAELAANYLFDNSADYQ